MAKKTIDGFRFRECISIIKPVKIQSQKRVD